ncbi:hypothetical protein ACG7TL_000947 [Trametes sanguinea]
MVGWSTLMPTVRKAIANSPASRPLSSSSPPFDSNSSFTARASLPRGKGGLSPFAVGGGRFFFPPFDTLSFGADRSGSMTSILNRRYATALLRPALAEAPLHLLAGVVLADRARDGVEDVREAEPAAVLVDGALDVVSVDVVEKAADRLRAGGVAVEARDEVVDERGVVRGRTEEDLTRDVGVVAVELLVKVRAARLALVALDGCESRGQAGEAGGGPWGAGGVGLGGEVVVDGGVDAHVVANVDGRCLGGVVRRRADDVVERGVERAWREAEGFALPVDGFGSGGGAGECTAAAAVVVGSGLGLEVPLAAAALRRQSAAGMRDGSCRSDSEDDSDYVPPKDAGSEDSDTEARAAKRARTSSEAVSLQSASQNKQLRPSIFPIATPIRTGEDVYAAFKASLNAPAVSETTPAPAAPQTVKIVKRYRYAGEEVTEIKEVPADSQEAKQWPLWSPPSDSQAAAGTSASTNERQASAGPSTAPASADSAPSSLSKAPVKRPGPRKPKKTLAPIPKKEPVKKLTTLDKSAMDWRAHVEGEAAASGVKDELEANRRGGGYLEKVEFLQRVEARKEETWSEECPGLCRGRVVKVRNGQRKVILATEATRRQKAKRSDNDTQARLDSTADTTTTKAPSHHTTPNTTVALKLTSLLAGATTAPGPAAPSASTSKYSSARNELDFHPQLWLTENTSGALVNRVRLAPVALAHAIVKYALTAARGSRYGCGGGTAVARAGSVIGPPLLALCGLPGRRLDERAKPEELGRDEERLELAAGELGTETVVLVRPSGDIGAGECVRKPKLLLPATDCGRGLDTDDDGPRPSTPRSRGGGGSAPIAGAEQAGMGSTVDWRWR